MRRAQQHTVTFTALDATTGAVLTGLTFATGETKVTKDGGALTNTTNAPTELGLGVYALTLTAAECDAEYVHLAIRKTGVKPADPCGFTTGQPSGAVVSDAGNSSTTFVTNLASSVTDFWKDTYLVFTTGALLGQAKKITGYNGTTKAVSFATGFTSAPSAADKFVLANL